MRVAVLGATGAVGRTMLDVLGERDLPVDDLRPLASPRSAGSSIRWGGREWTVRAPAPGCFDGVDVALFSAGAERSREWAQRAADEGAVVVDNSSAWRMDPEVPLVVPEINGSRIDGARIIANPNCSTIQMVLPLWAVHRMSPLRRVVATTFQSVSGAGESGRLALRGERAGVAVERSPFARVIDANVLPCIGDFDALGWSGEEVKMRGETRKILELPDLAVSATCVRVPVEVGHAVQVAVTVAHPLEREALFAALEDTEGVRVSRTPTDYPTPRETAGRDEVFVGRVRLDPDDPRVAHLWIVADNLRKGAATNAVQIVERLFHE